jgi:hypothetical protein
VNKFWVGYSIAVFQYAMTQDLMGKERYLKIVEVSWMNTPWWIWPILALFVGGLACASDYNWIKRFEPKNESRNESEK